LTAHLTAEPCRPPVFDFGDPAHLDAVESTLQTSCIGLCN
jgi:hypothetical protein